MIVIPSRSRLVAASVIALALSGAVVPSAAWAQDGPEEPVRGLLQVIAEKRFDEAAQYFCPEFADQAAQLDLGAAMASTLPAGVDPQVAEDALTFSVTGPDGVSEPVISVISETAEEASIRVEARLMAGLDPATSEPFIRAIVEAQLEESGMEVSEENIAAFMTLMQDQLQSMAMFNEDITTTLIVTPAEDGAWLICSPLIGAGASPGPSGDPVASLDPAAAPVEPAASAPPA